MTKVYQVEGRIRNERNVGGGGSVRDSVDMNFGKLRAMVKGQGNPACCSPWGRKDMKSWT